MNIEIDHTLPKDEAKNRITAMIARLRSEYGAQIQSLDEKWVNYTDNIEGKAKGYAVSGTIDIKDSVVDIDLKLPFMLKMFSGKIKSVIEDHVRKELV